MPINKNALIRYKALDKCFCNFGRKYYFDDLLHAVNEALVLHDPDSTGIQLRQLRSDISFMKSDDGFSAPIATIREGQKGYYRYETKDFSINKTPLNATEAEQLKTALSILERFEGAPQFEWMNEISPMISNQFGLHNETRKVIAYESNVDYSGYHHITALFNAIINERVLKVAYIPFGKEPFILEFHPYFLKQYNNRWFVFGLNDGLANPKWNMPLDRISSLEEINKPYIQTAVDWEDLFSDMIGVTRPPDAELVDVLLRFNKTQAPYIVTKPLHPSQKHKLRQDGTLEVRLKLLHNFELETRLLSFGETVEVLMPQDLKDRIYSRIKASLSNYAK